MNRTLIAAICLMLAFCTGIFFYAEWQKQKFDASLPEPPAPVQVQAAETETETDGGHWHGDEWHAEPHEVQNESNTSNGYEWHAKSDEIPPGLTNPDVNLNEFLTDSEIKELDQTLKREGFNPEKLSQRQLEHISVFGINLEMLPLKQRQQIETQIDRDYYAQFGLEPPPKGYRYSFNDWPSKDSLNVDENGEPILLDAKTGKPVSR